MKQTNEISLLVNGESQILPLKTKLQDLVNRQAGVRDTPVICAVNNSIIAKDLYSKTLLQDGDRVEILSPVAGG